MVTGERKGEKKKWQNGKGWEQEVIEFGVEW